MYDATNMAQNFAKIAMLRRSILQNDYSETHNSASQNNDRIHKLWQQYIGTDFFDV